MENNLHYYNWFQKIMSVFIDVFFFAAPLATLFVFTSVLHDYFRYAAFIVLIIFYFFAICFLKEKIRSVIGRILNQFSGFDQKRMFLIITVLMVVMKVVFTVFFNFDGTQSGDIQIYNDIAEKIIQTGDLHSRAISHLYGLALHFVLFKLLHIPLHIGLFLAVYCGVITNFFSFCKIVGKEKAFLITLAYILMPSTVFFSFCPTHEVFVFLYVSMFLFFFNCFLEEKKTNKICFELFMMVLCTVLTCFVNPGGYLICIIMILAVIFSNLLLHKKALIILVLILSVFVSNMISKSLNINEFNTTMNTYTILIHGVNPGSLGEQEDGYPLRKIREYIFENTLDFSKPGFVDAAKHVLINHYIYLLKHPVTLIKLILHKFYILWSGVHYPIELAKHYDAMNDLLYYAFLVINAFFYLFAISIGMVYRKKRNDEIRISNYKLEFLGVVALTMFCIVVNKYSVYVTMFLYLISFYRAEFTKDA